MICGDYILREESREDPDTLMPIAVSWHECFKEHDGGIEDYCCSGYAAYCPRNGGDDRLRRPDALTEDLSASIQLGVRLRIGNANTVMRDMLTDLSLAICRTGYEPLIDAYYQAGRCSIPTSIVSGYADIVPSQMEKSVAYDLEKALDFEFASFRPMDELPSVSAGLGTLSISSQDFSYISQIVTSAQSHVSAALEYGSSLSGFAHLDAPAEQALRELSDNVQLCLRGLADSFDSVASMFETGVRSSAGQTDFSVYSGHLPQWW